jgi:hypothetical protein
MAFIIASAIVVLIALAQLWRRLGTRRLVVAMVWFAGIVGALVVVIRVSGCADPPERPELVRDGNKLRHPYGFELLAPPATMTPDAKLAAGIETGYSNCTAWRATGAALVVCGVELEVRSRADLVAAVASIRNGIDRAASSLVPTFDAEAMLDTGPTAGARALDRMAAAIPTWAPDQLDWNADHGGARLEAVFQNVTIRAHLVTVGDHVAVIWAIARDHDFLRDIVGSLAAVPGI